MDEPFAAVDPVTRAALQGEMLRIQRATKKTIVFVTHDIEEALRLASVIAVLERGRLAQWGTPVEILERPASAFVAEFVGGDGERRCKLLALRTVAERLRPGETGRRRAAAERRVAARRAGRDGRRPHRPPAGGRSRRPPARRDHPGRPGAVSVADACLSPPAGSASASRKLLPWPGLAASTGDPQPRSLAGRWAGGCCGAWRLSCQPGAVGRRCCSSRCCSGCRRCGRCFDWAFPGVSPPVFARASFFSLWLSHAGLVAAASPPRRVIGVGAGGLCDPPGGPRFPADRQRAGDGRPDLSAGRGAGARGPGDRLRAAPDDRRAVSLRPPADHRERDRRARSRARSGARGRRRHGPLALAASARCRIAARRAGDPRRGAGCR